MEHGLSAEFDLSPSNDVLRTALCAAYALTADCNMLTDTSSSVTAATTQAPSSGGRRLAPNMHDTGPDLLLDLDETSREDAAEPRRLVSFDVAYTISVPVDSSVDFADILARANSIDTANSTALLAFTASLASNGITVSNVVSAGPPTVYTGIILVGADGKVISTNPSSSTSATSSTEASGGNIGLVIGGAIGGLIGLILIIACIYYFFFMRRKAEA